MKTYKFVYLNPTVRFSKKKDYQEAEDNLNKYVADGWILEQIVTPSNLEGTMIAVMYKE